MVHKIKQRWTRWWFWAAVTPPVLWYFKVLLTFGGTDDILCLFQTHLQFSFLLFKNSPPSKMIDQLIGLGLIIRKVKNISQLLYFKLSWYCIEIETLFFKSLDLRLPILTVNLVAVSLLHPGQIKKQQQHGNSIIALWKLELEDPCAKSEFPYSTQCALQETISAQLASQSLQSKSQSHWANICTGDHL